MKALFVLLFALHAWAAESALTLLASGKLNLAGLKKYSYVKDKILAHDKAYTVYGGFREPVFQVVLWGSDDKPSRILIEYDPKNENVYTLEEFNREWSLAVGDAAGSTGSLTSFSKENAAHIKAYCAKLPAGAWCSVRVWKLPQGKLIRADIHLKVGPAVPKALEFERTG